MSKVDFHEVSDIFYDLWCSSREDLFREIAWDCLDKAGMTTYVDERTHALIYLYAYVIQMLGEEFSAIAFDEYCAYDYEPYSSEPLTDAALGWLYREILEQEGYTDIDSWFSSDSQEILRELIFALRHRVADVIFRAFGDYQTGMLLYFAIKGKPLQIENDDYDEDDDDAEPEDEPEPFSTKEELIQYCKDLEFDFEDVLDFMHGTHLMHWLSCHSCAVDD